MKWVQLPDPNANAPTTTAARASTFTAVSRLSTRTLTLRPAMLTSASTQTVARASHRSLPAAAGQSTTR